MESVNSTDDVKDSAELTPRRDEEALSSENERIEEAPSSENDDEFGFNSPPVTAGEQSRVENEDEKRRSGKWKEMQPDVSEKLSLERLHLAYIHRDKDKLATILKEIRDNHPHLVDTEDFKRAEIGLDILLLATELREACDSRDVKQINDVLNEIRRLRFTESLSNEIREARYVKESIAADEQRQRQRGNFTSLKLDRMSLGELRRYHKPSPRLHRVLQGVLLLLGEDEDSTENWKDVQRMFMPTGERSVYRRLMDFDVSKVQPELASRSKVILSKYDDDQLRQTSPTVFSLYVWSMGVIDEVIPPDGDSPKPANRTRQKELLGRKPPDVQRMNRYYYQSLATNKQQHHQQPSYYNRYAQTSQISRPYRQTADQSTGNDYSYYSRHQQTSPPSAAPVAGTPASRGAYYEYRVSQQQQSARTFTPYD
jgi:hypothetical protein